MYLIVSSLRTRFSLIVKPSQVRLEEVGLPGCGSRKSNREKNNDLNGNRTYVLFNRDRDKPEESPKVVD